MIQFSRCYLPFVPVTSCALEVVTGFVAGIRVCFVVPPCHPPLLAYYPGYFSLLALPPILGNGLVIGEMTDMTLLTVAKLR